MRLTVADLALAIGKDENYVRQHIRRKNLTAEKDGGRVFVEEAEAVRWAKERGLPLTQAIITPESDGEVSTRAARMTVLAVRAPNGTAANMFTLEVWPESHCPGFALRQADVFQSYTV